MISTRDCHIYIQADWCLVLNDFNVLATCSKVITHLAHVMFKVHAGGKSMLLNLNVTKLETVGSHLFEHVGTRGCKND